ncbi:branched-chain amino acid ABC transporter permease [Cellulosimicrobium sp. PMB13]|uniref:branched-chain amino acid ABC transporter permease n=1 Tax=Cellulosimicrobium sp. PMB13 TaxID=3120158 RepID=UPI003F4B2D74
MPDGAGPAAAPAARRPWGRVARLVALAVGVALVLAFPTMAPNAYILSAGIVVASYACTATAWNFMGGFTGYVSLGHAAFFGLGAYGTGILIRDLGLPSFVAWLLAGVMVLLITIPLGIAALRVRGASFVIVSIAFVLILLLVFQAWGSFTGGSDGLVVPRPFPDLLRPEHHRVFFYLFAALLAVMLLCWWAIDRSRFGTGLKAVREDEDKAQALGVPTRNYKLVAYVVSATFTGLAGGMYALWFGDLDPIFQFSIMLGSYMVLMALFGGVRHLYGPLLGAVVVGFGLEYFKLEFGDTQFHLVATALLLGIVVLFMPDGIIPAVQSLLKRLGPQDSSIREMTAADLLEHNRAAAATPSEGDPDAGGAPDAVGHQPRHAEGAVTTEGPGEDEGPRRGGSGGSERGTSERMVDAAPRPRTGPHATTPDATTPDATTPTTPTAPTPEPATESTEEDDR